MPLDNTNRETGWIGKYAMQNGALAADSVGREAMADGYIQSAKIADTTITAAKLAQGAGFAGYYGLSTYGNCFYG